MMTATIDDEGRCLRHPFVQLSRRSSRTGEWKALLDSCPLCVMDISTTGNQAGDESLFVQTAETPGARLRGRKPRQVSSSLPTQRSRSGSSCGSRVRFQPDTDIQFTTTNAVTRAKSVLRASPRYKVCEELMQQQLEVNVKVTTMSMDMSIDFSTLDDEDSRSNFNCNDRHDMEENHQHQHHDRKDHYQHEDDKEQQQQQVEDENANEDEDLLPSLPPPSLPHRNENDSKETPATKHDDKEIESNDNNESQRRQGQERDDASKSGSRGRRSRSYQQVRPVLHRPDPEEFLRDDISGCGSQTSTQDHQMQQRSSPSQRHRGRREVDIGDHQPRSRSASFSFSHHHQQEHQPQRPQHNDSRSRHASPGSSTRNNHHHNHWQQQPLPLYSNMVINPVPNDDEVSALTFMGHSVQSSHSTASPNIHRASICSNSSQEQDEDGPSASASEVTDKAAPISVMSLSTMMADTNEFDPKTGRCIHHPHVRLRKKKLFGKGWKVMMSACPDCCVGELRKIRLAEENNLKRTLEKRSSIESYSRRVSNLTCDSGDVDKQSTYSSDGSKSGGRGNEGETSTSRRRGNSCSRSSSFHGGPTSFVTDPKTKVTSIFSNKMTQLPPPRRSSSQDIHRGSLPLPLKKDKLHIEKDETTASLTVSSIGSTEKAAIDNSNRTDVSSLSQEEEERSQMQQEDRATINVRLMRWTDPMSGQSGTYTGQVNDLFVPHGCGAMEYCLSKPNPNNDKSGLGVSVVLVKDGEWKDGRFRRNRQRSRGNSVNVKRSSGSFSEAGSEEGSGDRLRSSSVRPRCTGQKNSIRSTSHSQQRQRPSSRMSHQVSF